MTSAFGLTVMDPEEKMIGESVELLASHHPGAGEMDAYERVLGDAMEGDATLFAREDYVEEAWRIVDPVLKAGSPIFEYEPNTWGPSEVDTEGRTSRRLAQPHHGRLIGTGDPSMKIEVLADADAVAHKAAAIIAAQARDAVIARGRFTIKARRKDSGVTERTPSVVIVGGGFGGLAAAMALRKTPVRITLIDRTNHHLFQPLLYQVATCVLTPEQIGSPIRGILGKQRNTTVILGDVTGVDKERQCVFADSADRVKVPFQYDYLILATGASPNYFGHKEFETFAPGLKNLADAIAVRNKILQAFEQAEAEEDPSRHRDLLTFVLVGAGPTGVEMAAAIAVLVRTTLQSEFRRINLASARIVLVDMANRVLPPFSESLSAAAKKRLEKLGVEVRLGQGGGSD